MWNLSQTRTRLGDRLAEESTVFWDSDERDGAINEAQRLIAAVTQGVPLTLTGNVSTATNYLAVSGKLLGTYASAGTVTGGGALTYVASRAAADLVWPAWQAAVGTPRWAIPSMHEGRVYLAPVPTVAVAVTVNVSVLPADLVGDSEILFADAEGMEKYQGALLNLAVSLLLLKERYDNDAERFWQFAVQEIQMVGGDATRLPPMSQQGVSGG